MPDKLICCLRSQKYAARLRLFPRLLPAETSDNRPRSRIDRYLQFGKVAKEREVYFGSAPVRSIRRAPGRRAWLYRMRMIACFRLPYTFPDGTKNAVMRELTWRRENVTKNWK